MNEFFAVTVSGSLYKIWAPDLLDMAPTVTKIAVKEGSSSSVPPGTKLANGDLLSVGKRLTMFVPERYGPEHPLTAHERNIERVSSHYLGGQTTEVVALFVDKVKAQICLEASGLRPCDPRWHQETKEVLVDIGPSHPYFVVATDDAFGLFPGERLVSAA